MSTIVITGGGAVGLTTAMLLARDGHDVTVFERDPGPPPDDIDAAWATWKRRGVNQFRQLHLLLPKWRELIEDQLPEVLDELEGLGAWCYQLLDECPLGPVSKRAPGDERFAGVTARRPVIELAVSRVAERAAGVTIRRGVGVRGLRAGDHVNGATRVTGVCTDAGDEVAADLVIDAAGRRSAVADWLTAVGAPPPTEEREDSGFVYYARHFRSSDGSLPERRSLMLTSYGSVSLLLLPADNGTWGVGIIAASGDSDLRPLRDQDAWHAAISRFPLAAHWAEAEPIGDVLTMSKIEDRRRRFVVDGRPVVVGIVPVADSWACTNPSLGRGITIGTMHACALRDTVREVSVDDPLALALRWDEVTREKVDPWYDGTLAFDRARLAEMDAERRGEPFEADPVFAITRTMAQLARTDREVYRGFAGVMSLTERPEEAMARPGLFDRVLELAPTAEPAPGPDRSELVAAVSAAADLAR